MSARNKQRGYELEREVVVAAQAAGLEATRVFGSGAFKNQLGDDFCGDVVVGGLRIECKRRKSGFKLLYDAMNQDETTEVVAIRADRSPRLYLLSEQTFHKLLKEREEKKCL